MRRRLSVPMTPRESNGIALSTTLCSPGAPGIPERRLRATLRQRLPPRPSGPQRRRCCRRSAMRASMRACAAAVISGRGSRSARRASSSRRSAARAAMASSSGQCPHLSQVCWVRGAAFARPWPVAHHWKFRYRAATEPDVVPIRAASVRHHEVSAVGRGSFRCCTYRQHTTRSSSGTHLCSPLPLGTLTAESDERACLGPSATEDHAAPARRA